MDRPAPDDGPRLAPHAVLLHRSDGELQIGVDPSVVVPRSYEPVVRALASGASVEGPELDTDELDDLLTALRRARLLERPRSVAHTAVRVVGAGPLGVRTAQELVAAGFGTVYVADLPDREAGDRPRRPNDRAVRLDLLVASLAPAAGLVRVRRCRHFLKPEGDAVALTLVVADGPEPDRLVTDLLRDHGAPHLVLRSNGDEVTVGPLVVPGETSCVRCADLARRDLDERWPWLLDQLTRTSVTPSPPLLAWAAATATVQALAFVGGRVPETSGHTIELRADDHAVRVRDWPVRDDCPCRSV